MSRVLVHIDAFRLIVRGATPHRAEHRVRRCERPVELAQAPEQATVRRRVAPVERVAVIEVDGHREGLRRIACVSGECLAPRHPHVVVDLAMSQQRMLHRVPECIARAAASHVLPIVQFARVAFMLTQRGASPCWQRIDGCMIGAMMTEGVREFAPHEQLVEPLGCAFAVQHRRVACEPQRRHHAVVQVGRHASHAIAARGVVARPIVPVDTTRFHELRPARVPGARTAARVAHRPDCVIDSAGGDERHKIGCGKIDGRERQFRCERRSVMAHLNPRRANARAAKWRRGVAIGEGPVVSLGRERDRHYAGCVHLPERDGDRRFERLGPVAKRRNGHQLGDHQRCASGERLQVRTAVPLAFEVECRSYLPFAKLRGEIARALENEHVMSVAGVRIHLRQRMVDEDRHAQRSRSDEGDIECRVFVGAYGSARPIKHELTGASGGNSGTALDTLGEVPREQGFYFGHDGGHGGVFMCDGTLLVREKLTACVFRSRSADGRRGPGSGRTQADPRDA